MNFQNKTRQTLLRVLTVTSMLVRLFVVVPTVYADGLAFNDWGEEIADLSQYQELVNAQILSTSISAVDDGDSFSATYLVDVTSISSTFEDGEAQLSYQFNCQIDDEGDEEDDSGELVVTFLGAGGSQSDLCDVDDQGVISNSVTIPSETTSLQFTLSGILAGATNTVVFSDLSIIIDDELSPRLDVLSTPELSGGATVSVEVAESGSGLSAVYYAAGEHTADEFPEAGTEVTITYGSGSFFVETGGTYTVYAVDYRGNESLRTVDANTYPGFSGLSDQSIQEDNPLSFTFNVTDAETAAGSLTVSAASSDQSILEDGSIVISNVDGLVSFSADPVENANGTLTLTLRVTDEGGLSSDQVIDLEVEAVNDQPVANSDSVETDEDVPVEIIVLANDTNPDNGTLTVELLSQPEYGQAAVNTSGTVTYTPLENYSGSQSFTYQIVDSIGGDTASAEVSITINPVNDAPKVVDDSGELSEDGSVSIAVLENDSDVEGDAFSIASYTEAEHGSLDLDTGLGSFTYTAYTDYSGSDAFSYTVQEDEHPAVSATAWVYLTITGVNDPPVPSYESAISTDEDTPVDKAVTATDVDGDTLEYQLKAGEGPLHGAVDVDLNTGDYTYTPTADYNGQDEFTITVSDGSAEVDCAITVTVNAVNDEPVVSFEAEISTDEDTPVDKTITASDVDPDTLEYTLKSGEEPLYGSVVVGLNTGDYTYTPTENYNGPDEFTITVSDGTASVDCAITVTVNSVNDEPVPSYDAAISTDEDTSVDKAVTATDAELDTLEYTLKSGEEPLHGSVVVDLNTGDYTYTPTADYNGQDEFTITVSDGTAGVDCAITVTVNAVNDDPVPSYDAAISTDEDTPVDKTVTASDVDPDTLEYTLKSGEGPLHGTVVVDLNTGDYTYTPTADYNGQDGFTITVSDGTVGVDCAITVTVNSVNDEPVPSYDAAISTDEDTPVDKTVTATDVDPDTLEYTLKSGGEPLHGTVVVDLNTGDYTYTPTADYNGQDGFTITVSDGTAGVDCAITVTVNAVNDDPVPNFESEISTDEDTPVDETVTATDVDPDTLEYTLKSGEEPLHGTVVVDLNTGDYTYTPAADYNGPDEFTITVSDGTASVDCAITVTVNAVNDDPVPSYDAAISTDEDTPVDKTVTATDVDPDTLEYTLKSGEEPLHGTVVVDLNTGDYTYTPTADYNGPDEFTITVSDGTAGVDCAITVTVNSVNDEPVPSYDAAISTDEDTPVDKTVTASDVDLDTLSYTLKTGTGPEYGEVEVDLSTGDYTYSPVENYNGTDSFTITVSDGKAEVDCLITVTVNAVNDDPVAVEDSGTTDEDIPLTLDVMSNDSDVDTPEGDSLSVSAVIDGPDHGSTEISGTDIIYTPAENYYGDDEFTYQIIDSGGLTASALVSITINSVNDAPTPEGLLSEYTTNEDTAITIDFDLTDVETPAETLTMQVVSGDTSVVSQNRITISGLEDTDPATSITINPLANQNGDVDFTLRTSDGFQTAVYSFTLHVTAVNDDPVAHNDSISFTEDNPVTIDISSQMMANDTDIDNTQAELTFDVIVSTTSNGSLVNNGDGTLTYTPSANFDTSDTFTYRIKDPDGATSTATVTLVGTAVNDPPIISEIDDQTIEEDGTVVVNFTVDDYDLETEAELNTLMITTYSTNPDLLDDSNMRVTGSGENRIFTAAPLSDKYGSLTVTITVSDGIAEVSEGFELIITAEPDYPVAEDDFFYIQGTGSHAIDPIANDWDADGDIDLTPAIVSAPLYGSLTEDGSAYIYTAGEDFYDSDSFTYTVTDSTGLTSESATVTLSAEASNQPPEISAINNQVIFEDESDSLTFTVEDEDDDLDQVSVSSNDTALFPSENLVLSNVDSDYTLDFTPAEDAFGKTVLTIQAEDTNGNITTNSFTVKVVPINDLPNAVDDEISTNEDTSKTFNVLSNDYDVETSTDDLILREVTSTPSHGTLTSLGSGQFRYTPNDDYNGTDSFTYEMADADGGVASATVAITIISVNDAPDAYTNYLTTVLAPGDTLDNINVIGNDTDPDMAYDPYEEINVTSIVSQPACGTAYVNTDGTLKYEAFEGSSNCSEQWIWFTYEIEDNYGATDTASVSVAVDSSEVNLSPRVVSVWRSMQEDGATITITLSSYAFDPDGDTLTYDLDLASPPDTDLGTATIEDSVVSYTPGANKNGSYSDEIFQFTVSDGNATSSGNIYVRILSVNDAPTISMETSSIVEIPDQTISEDGTLSIDFYIDDVDKDDSGTTFGIDDLGLSIYSDDTAIVPSSSISYTRDDSTGLVSLTITPVEDEFGSSNITVVVTDGLVYTTDVFLLTVEEVNDPPVASDYWVTTNEDEPVSVDVIDYQANVDGDTITISQGTTAPSDGSLSFDQTAGEVTYTPDADFNGSDTFEFVLTDESSLTDSGTVYVTVNAVNDPPDIYNLSANLETPEDTTVETTFNVSDVDTDLADMTISAVSSDPSLIDTFTFDKSTDGSGEVTLSIKPAANLSGTVTIDVTASDGDKSDIESLTLQVYAVNDSPEVQDDAVEIDEDNSVTIDVLANDTDIEDPDALYVVSNTSPLLLSDGTTGHGSVVNNNDGTLTYTPGSNEYDDVYFTYEVSDSGNLRGTGTVTVTINSVNDAPEASNDSRTIVEDNSVTIAVLDNDSDVEDDAFSVTGNTDPTHGSVDFDSDTQSFTYTPELNYTGSDSFTYTIAEDSDPSMTDTATVSISITAEDDYPIISTTEPWVMDEDTTESFDVSISDAETASANLLITFTSLDTSLIKSYNVVLQGSGTSRTVQLTPVAEMNGSLQLQIDVNDGALTTTELVDIVIQPVNDPPVAQDYDVSVDEDDSVSGTVVVKSDIDLSHEGDTHTYSLGTDGANGSAVVETDGDWTYTPNADFNGSDQFTVIITDSGSATATSTITVTVNKINDTPQVTSSNTHVINEDTSVTDTIVVSDPDLDDSTDPDSYSVQLTTDASHGTVALDSLSGVYTYTPELNYNGSDSFTVKVTDEHDAETSKTVDITVDPVNDPPVAEDDSAEIDEDGDVDIDVLANDDDIDLSREGDDLIISAYADVDNGTVVIASDGKSLNFDADADWYGTEVFTYTVTDKEDEADQAEVTVKVNAVNDGPLISDVPDQTIEEDSTTGAISFTVTDVDDDDGSLIVTAETSNGVVIPEANIVLGGSGSSRTVTITPPVNKNTWDQSTSSDEPVTITLTVSDGSLTDMDTFTVSVTPLNDTPVLQDDTATLAEDGSLDIDVLANDDDIDISNEGDALTILSVSNVDNADVTIISGGTELRFKPDADWYGTEVFNYTVQDQNSVEVEAEVTVTVTPVNDAPIISNVVDQTIEEDSTTGAIDFTVTDVDNEAGKLDVSAATSSGVVIPEANIVLGGSGSGRTVTITPLADKNTWDQLTSADSPVTITLTVSDGSLTDADTFDVTITPLNDGPLAVDDSDSMVEDGGSLVVDVLANDDDVDLDNEGDDLTIDSVSGVDNASVSIAADGKSITFTPTGNWNGVEEFSYVISDQDGETSTADVTITVTAGNDAPDAVNDTAAVDEDGSVEITVLDNDTDIDLAREGDDLTIQSYAGVNYGSVNIAADGKSLTFTPEADWSGTEVFTYTITDTHGATDTASVTVTVAPLDDDPVANDDSYTVSEDASATSFNVLFNDTDADLDYGDALEIVQITSPPSHGTVQIDSVNDRVIYTPNANYNGSDSFTYQIKDDQTPAVYDTAVVDITVTSVNDLPVVTSSNDHDILEDTSASGTVTVSDVDTADSPDPDSHKFTVDTDALHGTVSLNEDSGAYTYTPNADYNGTDEFVVLVTDERGGTVTQTVEITIGAINDAPVANDASYNTPEDVAVSDSIDVDDPDVSLNSDVLTFTVINDPSNGTLVLDSLTGDFTYTPDPGYNGADAFTVEVSDLAGEKDQAVISLYVNYYENDPVAVDDWYSMDEDEGTISLDVLENDEDSDLPYGDELHLVSITNSPTHGNAQINTVSGEIEYTPDANYNGMDTFDYQIKDNQDPVASDDATVTMTINPVNDVPVITSSNTADVDEDATLTGSVTFTDPDTSDIPADTHLFYTDAAPLHGKVDLNQYTGEYLYTPASDYNGSDSFTLRVTDSNNASDTQTITVTVQWVDDDPVAKNDSYRTNENASWKTLDVLANDSDADLAYGDVLTITQILTDPTHGTVQISATTNTLKYKPKTGYHGTDSFEYEIRDNQSPEVNDSATVTVKVSKISESGTVYGSYTPKRSSIDTSNLTSIVVLFEDNTASGSVGTGGDSYLLDPNNPPANGTVVVNSVTGEFTYTPNDNFNGNESFGILIRKNGKETSQVVELVILPVNDQPAGTDLSGESLDGEAVRMNVLAEDIDIFTNEDQLTYTLVNPPQSGQVDLDGLTGEFTYYPQDDFIGTVTFTIRVQDEKGEYIDCLVTINVKESSALELTQQAGDSGRPSIPAAIWLTLGSIFFVILIPFFFNVRVSYMKVKPDGSLKKVSQIKCVVSGKGDEVVINLKNQKPGKEQVNKSEIVLLRSFVKRFKDKTLIIKRQGKMIKMVKVEANDKGRMVIPLS